MDEPLFATPLITSSNNRILYQCQKGMSLPLSKSQSCIHTHTYTLPHYAWIKKIYPNVIPVISMLFCSPILSAIISYAWNAYVGYFTSGASLWEIWIFLTSNFPYDQNMHRSEGIPFTANWDVICLYVSIKRFWFTNDACLKQMRWFENL